MSLCFLRSPSAHSHHIISINETASLCVCLKHQNCRINSDRGGTRTSTPTTHMTRRCGRSDDDDSEEQSEDGEDVQAAEERLRYRSHLRRRYSSFGSERGISLKLSLPDKTPKLAPRFSPISIWSQPPNSLSLHLPAVLNPKHHPAASDETTQQPSQPLGRRSTPHWHPRS
jgi:hypothetical protein